MEMKKKYVVTTKTTETKSALATALFALAIVFMLVSAVWSFTLIKDSSVLAISVLIIAFLLGLCLIGISNIVKSLNSSSNQKYVVEEVVEEAAANTNKSTGVSQEIVKAELMAVLASLVKEEIKKTGVSVDKKAEPVKAAEPVKSVEPAKPTIPVPPVMPPTPAAPATPVVPVTPVKEPEPVREAAPVKAAAPIKDETVGSNEWKCRVCGRVNRNYVGMCACGNHISENNAVKKEEPAISKPSVEEAISRPSVEAAISRPSVEEAISRPSVEPAISKPSVEEAISRPSVEAAISRPSIEEAISRPSIDDVIRKPAVDDVYSRPEEKKTPVLDDDDDEVLSDTVSVEKRVIGPVSDGGNWVCKLCGRVNPKFVGTCECGNGRITNNTYGATGNSMINNNQSRASEGLRETVRLVPRDNVTTQPVKETPKTPNLDFNSDDYDVAAARAAEEAAAAANAKVDIPMPASSRVDTSNSTQISATEWRCNVCNRINRNYIGTCACGNARH